jgi:hypothetical protein
MEILHIKERFIEMRAKGYSFDKIAKELGKAKQTLIDWSKELKEEIANYKALELEALYEKFFLLKESRVETFGVMIGKIKEELLNRNLSDVPTDKLLDLLLKYESQIKEEIIEPQFKTTTEIEEEKIDRALLKELTSPTLRELKAV